MWGGRGRAPLRCAGEGEGERDSPGSPGSRGGSGPGWGPGTPLRCAGEGERGSPSSRGGSGPGSGPAAPLRRQRGRLGLGGPGAGTEPRLCSTHTSVPCSHWVLCVEPGFRMSSGRAAEGPGLEGTWSFRSDRGLRFSLSAIAAVIYNAQALCKLLQLCCNN